MLTQIPSGLWSKLGLLLAFEYSPKSIKKYIKLGVLGYIVYQMYLYKTGGIMSQGIAGDVKKYKVDIDTDMAMDLLAPQFNRHTRAVIKQTVDSMIGKFNKSEGKTL